MSVEYAMFNQHNLTCYRGKREELSAKQRDIIKTLRYKYCGKNNWLYFMSYEPGYCPYNLNQNEVLRMTELLGELSRWVSIIKIQNLGNINRELEIIQ